MSEVEPAGKMGQRSILILAAKPTQGHPQRGGPIFRPFLDQEIYFQRGLRPLDPSARGARMRAWRVYPGWQGLAGF